MMKPLIALAMLAMLAAVGVAIATTPQDVPVTPVSDDGSGVYAKKCAMCHGKDGRGNEALAKKLKVEMAALDLLDEASMAKSGEEWVRVTTEGEGKMPAYAKKLSAEEIASSVSYARSLAQ